MEKVRREKRIDKAQRGVGWDQEHIHSFSKYLLRNSYVPHTGETKEQQTGKIHFSGNWLYNEEDR